MSTVYHAQILIMSKGEAGVLFAAICLYLELKQVVILRVIVLLRIHYDLRDWCVGFNDI